MAKPQRLIGRTFEPVADAPERESHCQLFLLSLIPTWLFWSFSPVLLVEDGGRGKKFLLLAGLAGVIIDGLLLVPAGRIVFPILLDGWTQFGPIGV